MWGLQQELYPELSEVRIIIRRSDNRPRASLRTATTGRRGHLSGEPRWPRWVAPCSIMKPREWSENSHGPISSLQKPR